MIYKLYRLNCDFCCERNRSVNSHTDEAVSAEALRTSAAVHLGWTQRRVANGSLWDCCPDCQKEDEPYTTLDALARGAM
jgi:hypothetical protein